VNNHSDWGAVDERRETFEIGDFVPDIGEETDKKPVRHFCFGYFFPLRQPSNDLFCNIFTPISGTVLCIPISGTVLCALCQ
jgi:hypothetical protein